MEEENKTDEILDEEVVEEELEETPDEEEPQEESFSDEVDDQEPPTRKTADYWQTEKGKLETKNARAAYFKAKKGEDPQDIRKVIQEEIGQAMEPFTRVFKSQSDEKEMQDVLAKYPEAKKLENQIRKYASSQAYSQVPIEFIARGLLADRSSKKAEADNEAAQSRLGGHSRRPQKAELPDFSKMTDQELSDWERKNRPN